MLRTSVLKLGATAAAAGAASSQLSRVTQADARPTRPTTLTRSTKTETSDLPLQVEDEAWLEVSLNEDGVVFGRAEVEETVEEIIGLCSDDDSSSGGLEADAAIDANNSSLRSNSQMDSILRASERLLGHSNVQMAALNAIRDDQELRRMIEDLSKTQINLVDDSLPRLDFNDRQRRRHQGNPIVTMIQDLGYQLQRFGLKLRDAGGRVAQMFRAAIAWLWNMLNEAKRNIGKLARAADKKYMELLPAGLQFLYNFGPLGRAAPIVVAGAMIVFVVMVMKRVP